MDSFPWLETDGTVGLGSLGDISEKMAKMILPRTSVHTSAVIPGFEEIGSLTLNAPQDNAQVAIIDPVNGYAYFGLMAYPPEVVKVGLNGAGPPINIGYLLLNIGELPYSAVLDTTTGYGYFGCR